MKRRGAARICDCGIRICGCTDVSKAATQCRRCRKNAPVPTEDGMRRYQAASIAHQNRIIRLKAHFGASNAYDVAMEQCFPGVAYGRLSLEDRQRVKHRAIALLRALNEWSDQVPAAHHEEAAA